MSNSALVETLCDRWCELVHQGWIEPKGPMCLEVNLRYRPPSAMRASKPGMIVLIEARARIERKVADPLAKVQVERTVLIEEELRYIEVWPEAPLWVERTHTAYPHHERTNAPENEPPLRVTTAKAVHGKNFW